MKIVAREAKLASQQSYNDMLDIVEHGIRVCYKSESNITDGSAENMIRAMIKRTHDGVLEHAFVTFKIVCDRATSHQIERHRTFSYNEMSQRYCNFSKDKFDGEIKFIQPCGLSNDMSIQLWKKSCTEAEKDYLQLLDFECKPEVARSVLPNSTATELYMTGNMRNWRQFLKLRLDSHAQADVRYIAYKILLELHENYPVFVEDLWKEYGE